MERCRLCGGELKSQFTSRLLGRYDVSYFRCSGCGSLQTERPYWLDEAYKLALTSTDVGAVNRCLENRAIVSVLAKCLIGSRYRMLDFGGGQGLLCRLLRDVGVDAWTFDSVSKSDLAQAFSVTLDAVQPGSFEVVTAFEVLEHLSQPDVELSQLFGLAPKILITSTEPYGEGIGADWWYLSPATGQHIFFYSQKALRRIAEQFGYHLYEFGSMQVFSRSPISSLTLAVIRAGLSRKGRRLLRTMIEASPTAQHIGRDFQATLGMKK